MTCAYCSRFALAFPGQPVPSHPCAATDTDDDRLVTITLTVRELRQVEHSLELTAQIADSIDVSTDALAAMCTLRDRFLDALGRVRA